MKRLAKIFLAVAFVTAFLPSMAMADGAQKTGLPDWSWPSLSSVDLKPIVITDSQGRVVELNSSGEIPVNAQFSGTVEGTSLLTDDNGDTAQISDGRNLFTQLRAESGDTADITKNSLHVYEQFPQRSIFNEKTGDTLIVNSDGEAKIEPPILSPSNGYTSITVSPGNSQTVSFSSTASRVSFNASGASEYRYELNSASADTSSMIVFEGQYIEKPNGTYDQITFYNLSTNGSSIDISVEPEF